MLKRRPRVLEDNNKKIERAILEKLNCVIDQAPLKGPKKLPPGAGKLLPAETSHFQQPDDVARACRGPSGGIMSEAVDGMLQHVSRESIVHGATRDLNGLHAGIERKTPGEDWIFAELESILSSALECAVTKTGRVH